MRKILLQLLGINEKPMTLREAIAMTNIDTDKRHRYEPENPFVVVNKNIHFDNVAATDIPKKLGLVHDPKVKTVYPEGHDKITFNQRTAALSRNLKKGLPKLKKSA